MDWAKAWFSTGSNKAKVENVSKLNPKWVSKTDNFTGLFGYASKLSATDKKKADQLRANLERYLEEITRAYDTIKGYTTRLKVIIKNNKRIVNYGLK